MNMLISEFSSLSNSKSVCDSSMSFKSCTNVFTELFKSKWEYIFDIPPEKLCTGNIERMYFFHSYAFVCTSRSNLYGTPFRKNTRIATKIMGETTLNLIHIKANDQT